MSFFSSIFNSYGDLLICLVVGIGIGGVVLFVALPRWVFRINEQILLLKQIYQELAKLNNKQP